MQRRKKRKTRRLHRPNAHTNAAKIPRSDTRMAHRSSLEMSVRVRPNRLRGRIHDKLVARIDHVRRADRPRSPLSENDQAWQFYFRSERMMSTAHDARTHCRTNGENYNMIVGTNNVAQAVVNWTENGGQVDLSPFLCLISLALSVPLLCLAQFRQVLFRFQLPQFSMVLSCRLIVARLLKSCDSSLVHFDAMRARSLAASQWDFLAGTSCKTQPVFVFSSLLSSQIVSSWSNIIGIDRASSA